MSRWAGGRRAPTPTHQLGLRGKLVLGAHAPQEREVDDVTLGPAGCADVTVGGG